MQVFAFDFETFPIRRGLAAPPPVCVGWVRVVDGETVERGIVTAKGEWAGDLPVNLRGPVSFSSLLRAFAEYARTIGPEHVRIVNQNIVFDWAVAAVEDESLLDLIFDLYDEGYIEDPMLREQLIDIALGSLGWSRVRKTAKGTNQKRDYGLQELALDYLDINLDKTTWRTGYARLVNVPLAQWAQGAVDYAIDDAEAAALVWFGQRDKVIEEGSEDGEVPDSRNQAKYHWGLQLMSVWGIRTDPKAVFSFKTMLVKAKAALALVLEQVEVCTEPNKGASCSHSWKVSKARLRACTECGEVWQPFLRPPGKNGKHVKTTKAIRAAIIELSERKGIEPKLTKAGLKLVKKDMLLEEDVPKYVSTASEHIDDLLLLFDIKTPNDVPEALELAADILEKGGQPDTFDGLTLLAWYNSVEKLLGTYMPALESGTRVPINARYRPLVETGRASCSKPNMMNLPKAPGVRECYIPRPGFIFCSVDYEALELRTLAQTCLELLGQSALADALNDDLDPHLLLAVEWLLDGIDYDEAKKARKNEEHPRHKEVVKARNMAKCANFGLPGGLGAQKFVDFCKASGVLLSLEEAKQLKAAWLKQWPEMALYFKYIKSLLEIPEDAVENEDGELPSYVTVEQLFSERVRGKTRYTAACNSFFQGLGADAAKLAVYELAKACYRSDGSLKGSRLVVFVHDETIMEHPDLSREDRHRRCFEQARIMNECLLKFTPSITPKAEPAAMPRWYKDAATKYGEDGLLDLWTPKEMAA